MSLKLAKEGCIPQLKSNLAKKQKVLDRSLLFPGTGSVDFTLKAKEYTSFILLSYAFFFLNWGTIDL